MSTYHREPPFEECRWEGCDDEQFKDWFYCEWHSRKLQMVNRFWAAVVSPS